MENYVLNAVVFFPLQHHKNITLSIQGTTEKSNVHLTLFPYM